MNALLPDEQISRSARRARRTVERIFGRRRNAIEGRHSFYAINLRGDNGRTVRPRLLPVQQRGPRRFTVTISLPRSSPGVLGERNGRKRTREPRDCNESDYPLVESRTPWLGNATRHWSDAMLDGETLSCAGAVRSATGPTLRVSLVCERSTRRELRWRTTRHLPRR